MTPIRFSVVAAALLCAVTGAAAQSPDKPLDEGKRFVPFVPRSSAAISAKEATRRLEAARLKRRQGVAPLPGELTQGARGGAPNYRYWKRQEKLRLVAEEAQLRWRQANATQVAQR
ncbi:MAG: hypothetical protein ABI654_16075 [Betaproteobacteria bacterium]